MSDLVILICVIIGSLELLVWLHITTREIKDLQEENSVLRSCILTHNDILDSHIKILQEHTDILEKLIEDKKHE